MSTINYYHFRQLDRASQSVYLTIAEALHHWKKSVTVPNIPELKKVIIAVDYDNPQFFYINWHNYSTLIYTRTNMIEIGFTYLLPMEEAKKNYAEFLRIIQSFQGETPEMTVANAFRFLTENVSYDYNGIQPYPYRWQDHSIYGPFIENRAVCEGISKAMQFILRFFHVECATILGQIVQPHGENPYHAWNLIRYNGQYRYFDATWDLSEYNADRLYYYNVPEEELRKTRFW